MNTNRSIKINKTKIEPNHSQSVKNKAYMTDDEKIDAAAALILKLYRKAFEELAK